MVHFINASIDQHLLSVDEILSKIVKKKYDKSMEETKKEFFIAAKAHPCGKGIYSYLHECNFPNLLSEISAGVSDIGSVNI